MSLEIHFDCYAAVVRKLYAIYSNIAVRLRLDKVLE